MGKQVYVSEPLRDILISVISSSFGSSDYTEKQEEELKKFLKKLKK